MIGNSNLLIKHINFRLSKVEGSSVSNEKLVDFIKETYNNSITNSRDLDNRMKALETRIDKNEYSFSEINSKFDQTHASIKLFQDKMQEINKKVDDLTKPVNILTNESSRYKLRLQDEERYRSNLNNEIKDLKNLNNTIKSELTKKISNLERAND